MGLDIYFYRVLDKKEESDDKSSIDLLEGETNKATLAVFDAFEKYVYEVENEYHDVWGYMKANGFKDYTITRQSFGNGTALISLRENGKDGKPDYNNGKKAEINMDNIPTFIKKEKRLDVCEVGYQRKGMKSGFYKEFVAGCWYITKDTELEEDDSLDIVHKKEDFERLKTYLDEPFVDEDSDYVYPMESWRFTEGKHLVYLSY